MQNEIYNGDIYYKRENPSVLYSLRGYNTNWHFPETHDRFDVHFVFGKFSLLIDLQGSP